MSGIKAHLVLLAGEVPQLQAPLYARVTIFGDGSGEEVQPVVNELLRVLARGPKVDQLDLEREERSVTSIVVG